MVKKTLQEQIYNELQAALMRGQFLPGEVLTIRALAGALGTSIAPVRDALQRLIAERALEILPNRSAYVPLMSRSEFKELTIIRLKLESLAVELAVEYITIEQLDFIRKINEEMNCAINKSNASKILERNMEFHFSIYRAAKSPLLFKLIESLWVRIGPLLVVPLREITSNDTVFSDGFCNHIKIINALESKNTIKASNSIIADIQETAEWYHTHYNFN